MTQLKKDTPLKDDALQVLYNDLSELKNTLKEEAIAEAREEFQSSFQEKLEEELAQLGIYMRNGEFFSGTDINSQGVFSLNDLSFAKEASAFFNTNWKPLIVETDSNGSISNEKVQEAIISFLMGAPLGQDIIASDNLTSLIVKIMKSAEERWKIDPNARSAVRSISAYTLGDGITIQAAAPKVQTVLSEYWNRNLMARRMYGAVPRRVLFGEHYFKHFIDKSGNVYTFDSTQPYDVGKILTHPEDTLRTLAFGVTLDDPMRVAKGTNELNIYKWYPDLHYFDQVDSPIGIKLTGKNGKLQNIDSDKKSTFNKANRIQAMRINNLGTIRGVTDMYTTLRWLKYYEDFVTDRVILNHERSKIVWVRKLKGSKGIVGGRAQRGPKGGQVLTETDQVEWKAISAEIHAGDVSEDGRLIRLMIGAGFGVPEHILFQDPSEQVYASIRSQDTPFSQMILWNQTIWKIDLTTTLKFVIDEAVKTRKLPKLIPVKIFLHESSDKIRDIVIPMLKEEASNEEVINELESLVKESSTKEIKVSPHDVKIRVSFPDVVQLDSLKKAQVAEVLKRATLGSSTSLAAKHGFDWREEIHQISSERDDMIKLGLIDDRILPVERMKQAPGGSNDTFSPTSRNEPEPNDNPNSPDNPKNPEE